MISTRNPTTLPSLAVAFSGAIWGLYWIPVRYLELGGIPPYWTTLFSFGIVGVVSSCIFARQWVKFRRLPWPALGIGLITGLSVVFYVTALVYTEVVKTLLLFYLLPVWSTILGKFMLKEVITWQRIAALILGIAGLLVILDYSAGYPKPSNVGDWLAIGSGLLWAWASILIRRTTSVSAWEQVGGFYIGGALTSLLAVIVPIGVFSDSPTPDNLIESAGWLLIFIGVYLPSMFLIFWGTQRLSPARAGILLMTEIIFGVISAAFMSGEYFGWLRFVGVLLIVGSAVVELTGKVESNDGKNGDSP